MQDLFGNEMSAAPLADAGKNKPVRKSVAAHQTLIALYGKSENQHCRNCVHFGYNVWDRKYPKCRLSGCDGHSFSYDWSGRWQACGKFENKQSK